MAGRAVVWAKFAAVNDSMLSPRRAASIAPRYRGAPRIMGAYGLPRSVNASPSTQSVLTDHLTGSRERVVRAAGRRAREARTGPDTATGERCPAPFAGPPANPVPHRRGAPGVAT